MADPQRQSVERRDTAGADRPVQSGIADASTDNQLSGCIPSGLRYVPQNDYSDLGLPFCSLRTDAILAAEREAIVALYDATNGADWRENNNWLSDAPLGEWHGVTTDDSGRVVELNLLDNQLSGEIPPELGNLANLVELYLSGNQLSGCLPSGLRYVPQNDFSDTRLPFCGLSTDAILAAEREVLVAFYEAVGGVNWYVNSNWLTNAPLGAWHGVTTDDSGRVIGLTLFDNQLSGEIPLGLASLSNLERLDLSRNRLSGGIPPELGRLSNLEGLDLSENQLSGEIPPELGGLSSLKELSLGHNQLSGEIPPWLGGLFNLESLHLSSNR